MRISDWSSDVCSSDLPLTNQVAYFNIPGWWDYTCGGEIDVTVTLKDGSVLSTRDNVKSATDEGTRNPHAGAWIVTAPPKFAPHMYHVVSILDRVYETFPEAYPHTGQKTNFYRDVYPVFANAVNYGWVSPEAAGVRSEEHTSELQSLMRISYAVFCLKK